MRKSKVVVGATGVHSRFSSLPIAWRFSYSVLLALAISSVARGSTVTFDLATNPPTASVGFTLFAPPNSGLPGAFLVEVNAGQAEFYPCSNPPFPDGCLNFPVWSNPGVAIYDGAGDLIALLEHSPVVGDTSISNVALYTAVNGGPLDISTLPLGFQNFLAVATPVVADGGLQDVMDATWAGGQFVSYDIVAPDPSSLHLLATVAVVLGCMLCWNRIRSSTRGVAGSDEGEA